MKKEPYASPVIELCTISKNDILLESDVLIDGSHLFQDQEQE